MPLTSYLPIADDAPQEEEVMRSLLGIGCALALMPCLTAAQPFAVQIRTLFNPDAALTSNSPLNALGAPDGQVSSLGRNGWIELVLGAPVFDAPGTDLVVYEEGLVPDEKAHIYLSFNGSDWTFIGNVLRNVPSSIYFDIAGSGMSGAQYVKVEDYQASYYEGTPGFDLDAVTVVPEPSGAVALVGLAAAIGFRRRHRAQ